MKTDNRVCGHLYSPLFAVKVLKSPTQISHLSAEFCVIPKAMVDFFDFRNRMRNMIRKFSSQILQTISIGFVL